MSSNNSDIRSLERIISTLLNKQLQQICSSHGLRTSGVKADLQNRIKGALHENYSSDPPRFNAIRTTIQKIRGGTPGQPSMPPPSSSGALSSQEGRNGYYNSYPYHQAGSSLPPPNPGLGNGTAVGGGAYAGARAPLSDNLFKNTPFYTIETRIGPLHTCPVMNNHRNSITINLKASEHADLSRCLTQPNTKLMVFCGSDSIGPQDVQFPHQSEIKVNGEDIKHNLRGLKNKPGSTHPVDITGFLRLKQANYGNTIEFTYALTNKKFYLALYLCQTHPIDELVTKIKGKKISKASVIRDITKKANDPDIEATSQVLSLKCPLSCTRMMVPCRGALCTHIQCFDAGYFMQLQVQGATWNCPVCYKTAFFDALAVDEYVQEVLQNTSESVEQVTIDKNGQWSTQKEKETPEPRQRSQRSRPSPDSKVEEDDDLSILSDTLKISNGNFSGLHGGPNSMSTPSRSFVGSGTPNGGPSTTTSTQRSGSNNKRPAEVIDLTLSSDEDDEPIVRPPKRQYPGPSSNGLNFPPFNNGNY